MPRTPAQPRILPPLLPPLPKDALVPRVKRRTSATKSVVPRTQDDVRALKARASRLNHADKRVSLHVTLAVSTYKALIELGERHHRPLVHIIRECLEIGARMYAPFLSGKPLLPDDTASDTFMQPAVLRAYASGMYGSPSPEPLPAYAPPGTLQPPLPFQPPLPPPPPIPPDTLRDLLAAAVPSGSTPAPASSVTPSPHMIQTQPHEDGEVDLHPPLPQSPLMP
jgi:hypothetical protein